MNDTIQNPSRWLVLSALVVWLLCISTLTVGAQGSTFTPIGVGENKIGDITTPGATVIFAVPIASPQTITVDVFAVTPGFLPAFRVIDSAGVVVQTIPNAGSQATVQAQSIPVNVGLYQIEVLSANNGVGQFLISVQPGTPLQPPQPILPGQAFPGSVSGALPLQNYSFMGSPTGALLLTVYSTTPGSAPVVTLSDATTAETLGVTSGRIGGLRYQIFAGVANYLVEVKNSDPAVAQNYIICLENDTGVSVCPVGPQPALAAPTEVIPPTSVATLVPLPSTGPCVVASAQGGSVNVRSGPSTDFSVLTQLGGNATAAVIGRLADGSWYQISFSGIQGWVSASVVRLGGQCGGVPTINLTPVATATGTTTGATATATATATPTWTETPTETETWTPTWTPTWTDTPMP